MHKFYQEPTLKRLVSLTAINISLILGLIELCTASKRDLCATFCSEKYIKFPILENADKTMLMVVYKIIRILH